MVLIGYNRSRLSNYKVHRVSKYLFVSRSDEETMLKLLQPGNGTPELAVMLYSMEIVFGSQ